MKFPEPTAKKVADFDWKRSEPAVTVAHVFAVGQQLDDDRVAFGVIIDETRHDLFQRCEAFVGSRQTIARRFALEALYVSGVDDFDLLDEKRRVIATSHLEASIVTVQFVDLEVAFDHGRASDLAVVNEVMDEIGRREVHGQDYPRGRARSGIEPDAGDVRRRDKPLPLT